jgi:peptide/nickel transport system ATP-binding protein
VSQPPVVRVQGVSKTFVRSGTFPWSPKTEVEAVKDVSFSVERGTVIALVGQSGSGKTTLSRVILGLEEPTAGEVWINAQRWDGLPEAQRRPYRPRYQYIPQDAMGALDPQQTALEHIIETMSVLGDVDASDAETRATELLTSLGLGQRLGALPREMSGGEQRRVTLARVLALDPLLIVADEPTSGLDPERRVSVMEALIGNLPEAAACILITHDMSEATKWCDRIYLMLEGQVVEVLEKGNLEPQHPYSQVLFDPWSTAATEWLAEHKDLELS